MMKRRTAQRGVTLIELLIALFVFALISSAGVYALRLAVEGREQLERSEAVLREWRLARLIIREDMAQLAPRIVRDEFGQSQGAAFFGGVAAAARAPVSGEELLAGFVRRGWANPNDAMPRSSLQYVEYVLKDGDIIRRSRPYLDDARNQPRSDRVLFYDVENVQFQFFAGETREGLQWSDIWPAPGAGGFAPRAVRLSFESVRFGPIEQLFWIGDLHHPGASAST